MMGDFRYPYPPPPRELRRQLLAALVGGFIAGGAYVGYGLWFETLRMPDLAPIGTPRLSYGQEAALLALVAAGVGAATGLAATLMLRSQWVLGIGLGVGFSILAGLGAVGLWADQRARYGYDPSEVILYSPLLAIVGAALVTTAVVGAVATVSKLTAWHRTD